MGDTEQEPRSFERARLALARLGLRVSDELFVALERAARVSARTLETERVGIWLLEPKVARLRCVTLFERTPERVSSGQLIELAACPAYADALRSRKFVAADDAVTDPRTRELAPGYLIPNGITSMLDAPIFRGGEVCGVVCHEHTGAPRAWSERDMDFAGSVADILSALFEQASRLALEEKLRRAERMESLGRLAAGVAHDFNGILGIVALNASLVEAAASAPPTAREAAQDILETVDVGRRLVGQLMAFARLKPVATGAIDVVEVVRAMQGLFLALQAQCHVELTLPAGELQVVADRAQLEQVVMNLVLNARDASPPGATVHVRIEDEAQDGERFVVLRVEDHGRGISSEVVAHLFEPFFTEGKAERGTGLGLATVLSIAEQCGGTVEVESELGRGSVFTVRLPRIDH